MADNTSLGAAVGSGDTIRTEDKSGVKTQVILIDKGGIGAESLVSDANPMPVSDAGGSVTVDGPLTDAELRASAVPVSGPLTDAELRATAVPVSGTVTASGPLTDAELRATDVPVSGPLTDAQLRATAVPISGTVALDAAALSALETITVASVTAPLAAGDNNVGNVDVASLPTNSTASAAAQSAVGTTAGQLLAANANRKRLMIQNTGLTVLKLVLGAGTPTQTVYHVALSASVAADDGKGAMYVDDSWTGAVQALSSAAGGTCVVTEVS